MKTPEQAYKVMTEAKVSFKEKASKGNLIQSFSVTMPVDYSRGSIIGTVTKVEIDKADDIEYVYFKPIVRVIGGIIDDIPKEKEFRVPQNGTPATTGKTTDGIKVL